MMSEYILKVGHDGAERLDLLSEVFSSYSQYFLKDIGLKKNMKVIEFGCGTGTMTTWIAQQVGPSGHVIAIDASEQQLELAKMNAKQAGLTNIEFIRARLEEVKFEENSIDLIYSRWLLMHLPHPENALKQMYTLLKTNGILACDEPTSDTLFTSPRNKVIERFNDCFLLLGKKSKFDFNIGDKLPSLLINLTCRLIKPRFIQPIISLQMAKKFISMAAKESISHIVKENIISDKEATEMLEALHKLPEDKLEYYAFPRQAQIAGIK